ncbi:porin [Cupriavidus sp. PET2-C1]
MEHVVHHSHTRRANYLLGAGLLAIAGHSAAAAPSTEQLQKEVEELKAAVQSLRQELAASRPKPVVAGNPALTAEHVTVAPQTPTPASTAPEGDYATKADIDGIRGDLENYKYEQTRSRETKTALTTRGTTIGGTVAVRGSYFNPGTTGSSTPGAKARSSSFDIASAQLNLSGSLYRDYAEGRNLTYRLALAYAQNVSSGLTTTAQSSGSQFNLTDAYLDYSFLPTTTGLEEDKLTVRFGQQQIPFGLEAQTSEELRPVINNAQFVNALGVGTRQIGVVFRGDYDSYVDYGFNYRAPLVEYAFGVFNGNGPNKADDNSAKDFIGRLAFTLPVDYNSVFRELKLGVSYLKGTGNLTRTVGTTTTTVASNNFTRRGLDLYYNHNPYGITYEYADGETELLAGSTGTGKSTIKSRGQYVTLYYQWGEQFLRSYRGQAKYDDWWPKTYQAFLRYDLYDPNTAVGNDQIKVATLGLNVFFAETTKLQLNLLRTFYQDPSMKNSTAVLAQFQYGF